ncbi:MAG: hypothetical protein DYG89_08125 [Caldilinea sp. CFX5]|nr:hypothetical protein [Caldilinea sp. CFX5]
MKTYLKLSLVVAMLTLLVNACQPVTAPTSAALPELVIHAHDYSYDLPKEIEAGLVRVTMLDEGQEPHHAQLVRFNDGVTMEQFMTALQADPVSALGLVNLPGGTAPVDPGASTSVIVNLTPGNYAVLCFILSPDGVPHVAKGMLAPLTVIPAQSGSSQASQTEPVAQATVTLLNFSFTLPSDIKAGKQTWKVVNEGDQIHEINLMKLAEGKTIDDLMAWVEKPEGAPPFTNVGGFNGIDPQQTGWMELDLTPGSYVAICHVPDAASGKAHSELGMMLPFEVKS